MIVNLTQHAASAEQIEAGVTDMVGKDLDIAAEIVGVESDDEGNRVVTVQLTENGAYAGKIELTAASADSENSMRITACKSYRAK